MRTTTRHRDPSVGILKILGPNPAPRCVPLYPPMAVYQALMGEPRSRVAACNASATLPRYPVRKSKRLLRQLLCPPDATYALFAL